MAPRQYFKQTIPVRPTLPAPLVALLTGGQPLPPAAPLISTKERARRKRRNKIAAASRARNRK